MSTRNLVGPIPEPQELYGRTDLLRRLWQQVPANNILLLAPRRFGKSGVMRHVLMKPREGYLPIALDLQDVDSPAEFVWRLTREILGHSRLRSCLAGARAVPKWLQNWVADTFDGVEYEGAKIGIKQAVEHEWQITTRRLLVELEKATPTLLFVFDELPTMIEKMKDHAGADVAAAFIAWFRSVRLQNKDQLRRHRFVVGGSIGLDTILRQLAAGDKLNDFERLYVGEIPRSDAERLVADLCAALDVSAEPELCHWVLRHIGSEVPYFIHLLFSQIAQLPPAERARPTPEVVERVYRERLLGPVCKHYFDEYRDRLRRYGKGLERAAIAVLVGVARDAKGRVSEPVLEGIYNKHRGRGRNRLEFVELMNDLECEWYLVPDRDTNEYAFKIDVMRDWWKRWYGRGGSS